MASLRRLAGLERLLLGLDELAQRGREVRLPEDLAGLRRLARLAEVRQEHRLRVGPLLDARLLALDGARDLLLDRVAVGHLDRRLEHVLEAHGPELGQHHQNAAGRPGRHRRERPVGGRVLELLRLEELGRGAGGRHAERVDANDLLRLRVVDERLGLAAPRRACPTSSRWRRSWRTRRRPRCLSSGRWPRRRWPQAACR